jgi:hypothetical protein
MFALASSKLNFVKFSLIAAFAVVPFSAEADDPKRKADYENRLGSVKSLSAAVSRDPKADSAEVKTAMAKVAARQKEAEELAAVGEYETARQILDEGYKVLTTTLTAMKSGSGNAAPAGSTAAAAGSEQDKARKLAAFDGRMSTAKAMLDAFKRQNQEKAAGKDASIADIETRLRQAETLRGADLGAAQGLLDDAYNSTKLGLQSMQTVSTMKTGSAALEAGGAAGNADATRAEIDRTLKSSALLREAVIRLSKEKGVDSSVALTRIDTLSGEARSRQAADPARALKAANEANQTAKDTLAKLR